MQPKYNQVQKKAEKIVRDQLDHEKIKLSKIQAQRANFNEGIRPLRNYNQLIKGQKVRVNQYIQTQSNVTKKDIENSVGSNDLNERIITNKSWNSEQHRNCISKKIWERQEYYEKQEIIFQRRKQELVSKNKTLGLNEAYNSISDIYDYQQILSNIKKLKQKDRTRLIDKINNRKVQIQKAKEQAAYYKHRNILQFYKNKFLQSIKKKRKMIDDDTSQSPMKSIIREEDEERENNENDHDSQQIYDKFKDISRLFSWTQGIEQIKLKNQILQKMKEAKESTKNDKYGRRSNFMINQAFDRSSTMNLKNLHKTKSKSLKTNLYQNQVVQQIENFIEQTQKEQKTMGSRKMTSSNSNTQFCKGNCKSSEDFIKTQQSIVQTQQSILNTQQNLAKSYQSINDNPSIVKTSLDIEFTPSSAQKYIYQYKIDG